MKHTTMTNYDDGDDDRDDDRIKDKNNDNNSASESVSDSLIFDPITTPRSCGEGSGDNRDGSAAAAHSISTLIKIYHKLQYAKLDILCWCFSHMKKLGSINKRKDYIFEIYNEIPLID